MADFADSTALALDVELLAPAAAGRLSPALPAGEQLLEANLYAVCERSRTAQSRAPSGSPSVSAPASHARYWRTFDAYVRRVCSDSGADRCAASTRISSVASRRHRSASMATNTKRWISRR
jgi:hypothetical protein